MKKKILLLLLTLCAFCLIFATDLVYASENDFEEENAYELEIVNNPNDSEYEIQFEVWANTINNETFSTENSISSTQAELLLVVVVKKEGSSVKINCQNVSPHIAYNLTFYTTVTGTNSKGETYIYQFPLDIIPALSPGKDSGSISHTLILLSNPLFVEVGVTANIAGELCFGYGLLFW